MSLEQRKKLTIITEAALESTLGAVLLTQGVSGYTVTNARGHGSHGARHGDWSSSSNIRIEVICEYPVAQSLADELLERFAQDYAMILYLSNVEIFRPERF